MRKIFVFFLIFISSQLFAQKEIIGSWKSKDTFNYYGVETFFANGNYRIDLFKKEGDYWMHMGFPDSGKWTLDSDGVLCTYGTQSVSTAFVKLDVFEDESLTAADIKRLKEDIPQLEKAMTENMKKNQKDTYQKSYFDIKFNEDGELQKRASGVAGGGIWYTFVKTDLPWTPARNSTKSVAPKKSVPQRRR